MSSQERALRVAQQQISNQRMVKAMINSELTTLRAENERLQAAVDKVLALHAKTTEEMLDSKCADGDCEHEDECPSVLVDVCRCCTEIAYQVSDEYWPAAMDEIVWPCPTVAALTQGGEGS